MKTGSTVKYVLRLTLTLLVITAVVAVILAAVNKVTAPIIARQKAEKTQQAVQAVLPGGGESVDFTDDTGLVTNVYRGEQGYAVEVAPQGFKGTITMMVGVDLQGNVQGISVISHTETAGLGAICGADSSDGEAFRGQFVGTNGDLAVTKDGGTVDAITNATITSRAVTEGVNAAVACVENFG